jgi:benzylsuccinate CoA-transferase BbsE subunit
VPENTVPENTVPENTVPENTVIATGGPLCGYRVLDLADEMAALCGKMFADLGADVVKVEPPAGCPTRSIPPFLDDGAGPDSSCYFLATAAGKRSVTLDLEQAQGRELLARLAQGADFLIESFPLGYLDGLGLSYETLAARNPRLIYTSVTPFGDLGPAAAWKAADIVGWAAGGMMAMMGEPGRPPLQVSVPQACSHAGSEAAVASMLAHLDRERSGFGQKVVVSMQAAGVWATNSETAFPALEDRALERSGIVPAGGNRSPLYRCADGYVQLLIGGGMFLATTTGLLDWAQEFGPLPTAVRDIDFTSWTFERFRTGDPGFLAELAACDAAIGDLLKVLTRAEISSRSDENGWVVAPVGTIEDVAHDRQLQARNYYQQVTHPGLDRKLTLVGPLARLSATPAAAARPAPALGEHNADVLCGELGISEEKLAALQAAGVIGQAERAAAGGGVGRLSDAAAPRRAVV